MEAVDYMPSISKYKAALSELINDYSMVGVEKMENYSAFAELWLTSGGAECTAEINTWYSAK